MDESILLDLKDLRAIYPQLKTDGDWHRLAQRLHVLNAGVGAPAGVRLALARGKGVRVQFKKADDLHRFLAALASGRGHVRHALAERIRAKAGTPGKRAALRTFVADQADLVRASLARDMGLPEAPDLDRVLVDPPLFGKETLFEKIASMLPGRLLLLGDSGGGKTTALYAILRGLGPLEKAVSGLVPVFVPMRLLKFEGGKGGVWRDVPGLDQDVREKLDSWAEQGRLLLLLDGLSENPGCLDLTDTAVREFWEMVGRNRFVAAMQDKFHRAYVASSPLHDVLSKDVSTLLLPEWPLPFCRRFAPRLPEPQDGESMIRRIERAGTFPWQQSSRLVRRTPLGLASLHRAWAGKPVEWDVRDDYETLEALTQAHIRHESLKGVRPDVAGSVLGVLMRSAWKASIAGGAGPSASVPNEVLRQTILEGYPQLGQEAEKVIHFITQLPWVESEADTAAVRLPAHFSEFLVIRYFLRCFLLGDMTRLSEVLRYPMMNWCEIRFWQSALRALSEDDKRKAFDTGRRVFENCWLEFQKSPAFGLEFMMRQCLVSLCYLDIPQTREFLQKAYDRAAGRSEVVQTGAALSLAAIGAPEALEKYYLELPRRPKAVRSLVEWYMNHVWKFKGVHPDTSTLQPPATDDWSTVCDTLLRCLGREAWPCSSTRAHGAFVLCALWENVGESPFVPDPSSADHTPEKVAWRLEALRRILKGWPGSSRLRSSPVLRRELKRMQRLARESGLDVLRP